MTFSRLAATKRGAVLMAKLAAYAADENTAESARVLAAADEDARAAALFLATKLIAEEVPLTRLAGLLATAEIALGE